jgi:hypothetical protein
MVGGASSSFTKASGVRKQQQGRQQRISDLAKVSSHEYVCALPLHVAAPQLNLLEGSNWVSCLLCVARNRVLRM